MTRSEVYDKCVEIIEQSNLQSFRKVEGKNVFERIDSNEVALYTKPLLPKEAIDAIIDCAVEEAVKVISKEEK